MTAGRTVVIGDVEITRVQEYAGPSQARPDTLFPSSDPAYWQDNADWLSPDFFDADAGRLRSVLHSWLIRSQDQLILLDTGAGNGKERPYAPVYGHHATPYLENLASLPRTSPSWSTLTCTWTTSVGTPSWKAGTGCRHSQTLAI